MFFYLLEILKRGKKELNPANFLESMWPFECGGGGALTLHYRALCLQVLFLKAIIVHLSNHFYKPSKLVAITIFCSTSNSFKLCEELLPVCEYMENTQ